MRTYQKIIGFLSLLCILGMESGCAVTLKPVVHTVPYQSDVVCATDTTNCPRAHLEEQAKFSALVNCLLVGANVLHTKPSEQDLADEPSLLVPTPPRYGYEFVINSGDGRQCKVHESACLVTSRSDNKLTWAGCGSEPLEEQILRGGKDLTHADQLTESAVVIGNLMASTATFEPPAGLDGPDQFYTFTLEKETYVETVVAANSSDWSSTKGHRAPWQPGLFLLATDGRKISNGHVWRGGVTYLLPLQLGPGTYYLIVDSSQRELTRGDGRYRLYLGLNKTHMGTFLPQ